MRATLADPALARYAGRFVWLELDFDKPVNQPFLVEHGCHFTPTLLIVDPRSGAALASHVGGMSEADLEGFLAVGEKRFRGEPVAAADSLLARSEVLAAKGDNATAATEAAHAIDLGGAGWAERSHAYHELTWAEWNGGGTQALAETAAVVAPTLPRDEHLGPVVIAGLGGVARGRGADWARQAFATLEPQGEAALGVPALIRDHRFQLYQGFMNATASLGDSAARRRWGHRWLDEIESIQPRDDDERSALDIARVDAAGALDEPERVLPALLASERAMPANYTASLRLAEMLEAAKRYQESLAACDRGLVHVTGPLGRSWLLTTEANAYDDLGDRVKARAALAEALEVAKTIGTPAMRDSNVRRIGRALEAYDQVRARPDTR